ncbi:MAG TPA: ABC transporter substrate-binding protein, partial [Polyangiaceae bacterium]
WFLVCVCCLLVHAPCAAAPAKKVYAGVYLHDVAKFDQKDGVFDADFELWVKWRGDFDATQLKIANAAEVDRQVVGEEKDGQWQSMRWRVRGTMRGEFPVQNFPFDSQTLAIVLELPERYGQLVPDLAGSGMRERFSITGWLYEPFFSPRVAQETYRSDLGAIAGEGRPTHVGRAAFEVTLRRPLLTAAIKLFLPLLVILMVAVVALFIHPKELEVRAAVGVTALLACFAFQFAVADSMPNVAYITLADLLFLVSYAVCAVLMAVSVAGYWLHEHDKPNAWKKLDVAGLIAFPICMAATAFFAIPSSAAAPKTPPAAYRAPRPKSERDVVRVGTNALPRPIGGLISRGVFWAVTRAETDGKELPVLVEQVPGITNDSLRFLADGTLAVTWRLRPNLVWSDGKPLTADDLKFALEVSPDKRIQEITVVDARELVVRYKERVAAALLPITPLPRHALTAAFKKGGFEAVREFRMKNVIPGAGPYRVAEFVANERAILVPNPHFAGQPPSVRRIEIRCFKTDAALLEAFEKRSIDLIVPGAVTPESAASFAKKHPGVVHLKPSEVLMFLHPDLKNPLLARREVRTAMLRALDRERMRSEVFGEAASSAPIANIPVPGPVPEGAQIVTFDAEAARAEFSKLGIAGARVPLLHGSKPIERAVVPHLVRDLAAAGITLEPREVEDVNTEFRKRKHGGLLLMSRTSAREDEPERSWNVPLIEGRSDRSYRSDAFTHEIVKLVEREERALYPERREQIRDLLFGTFSKNLPLLPLMFLADQIIAPPELHGWEVGGGGRNFGITLERWHFAASTPGAKR